MGKVLGIIILIILGTFAICSCKVASWADEEIEKELYEGKKNEKEIQSNSKL